MPAATPQGWRPVELRTMQIIMVFSYTHLAPLMRSAQRCEVMNGAGAPPRPSYTSVGGTSAIGET
jgi:hypothetical protein